MLLVVLRGPQPGQGFPLEPGENSAGRSADNAVHLPSTHVSGRHCSFTLAGGQVTVRDLGSTNGVYVEGHRVREAVLAVGQRVQIGDWLLQLVEPPRAVAPPAPERSVTRPSASNGPPAPMPMPPPPAAAPPPPAAAQLPPMAGPPPPMAGPPPAAGPAPQVSSFGQAPPGGFGSGGFGQPGIGPSNPAFGGQAAPVTHGPPDEPGTVTSDIPVAPRAQRQPEFAPPAQPAQPHADLGGFGGGSGGFGFGGGAEPAGGGHDADPVSLGGISPAAHAAPVEPVPEDLLGRALLLWRRARRLPWVVQLAAVLVLVGMGLLLTPGAGIVSQVLNARRVAQVQVLERGKALGLALAARNVLNIADQNNLNLDTALIAQQPGVKEAWITDPDGVIRAPLDKVRRSIGGKDYFVDAREVGAVTTRYKGGGIWYVMVPIRRAPVDGAPMAIMGWAYLEYDVNDAASSSTPVGGRMIASLMMVALLLGGGGVAIWRLATAPVRAVREDLELCLRGHLAEVAVPAYWRPLKDLGHSINRLIARRKKGESSGPESARESGLELSALLATVVDLPMPVFLAAAHGPILEVSQTACAWLGAPREALVGRGIDQVLPDAAFLDTLHMVCARVGAGEAASIAQITTIGANRVALRAVSAGSQGIVAVIAVG